MSVTTVTAGIGVPGPQTTESITTAGPGGRRRRRDRRGVDRVGSSPTSRRALGVIPAVILILGSLYCFIPLFWLFSASTKGRETLFTTNTFIPDGIGGFFANVAQLTNYQGGAFWQWMGNSVIYAGGGAALSVLVSAAFGYGLAMYEFRGKQAAFGLVLVGMLLPGVVIAIPQYLLMAQLELTNTYFAILLPVMVSPFGMWLCRVFAASSVPRELLDAGRVDGASEFRIFSSIGLRLMAPGLLTVFLLQFVGIWNNFLLPFIMLSDNTKYPLSLGLYSMMRGSDTEEAIIPTLVISGSLIATVPLIIIFVWLQKYMRINFGGGLKG